MGEESEYLYNTDEYYSDKYYSSEQRKFESHYKPSKIINGVYCYQCTKCKEYKQKEYFYKDTRNPNRIRNKCKKCYHK